MRNGTQSGMRRMTTQKIKPNCHPWKEKNRCRKNETVINKLSAGHTILAHGYLMEGFPCLNVSCITVLK